MGKSEISTINLHKSFSPYFLYLFASIILLFMILFLSINSYGNPVQPVEISVQTDESDLDFTTLNGYDLVQGLGDKFSLSGTPGEPWLPVRYIHVLLPPDSRATGIKAKVVTDKMLNGDYFICPAQKPSQISAAEPHPFVEPDGATYAKESIMPEDAATLIDTVIIRGYHIAVVRINPVAYIPAMGQIILREKIDISLSCIATEPGSAIKYSSREPLFTELVLNDVINPESMPLNYPETEEESLTISSNTVKYLLIGSSSTFTAFQPLLDWKTKKGIPAEAVSTTYIYSNYAGADNQTRIKACIKDYVQNKGTVWVVLAGDDTIVPDRDCYAIVNGDTADSTIPTDLYYAGLDDMNWDDDNDGIAAEIGDDTIDMGPDVFVGRLPIRNATHATAIVNKILAYEKNIPASGFAEKMILSGIKLWNDGDAEGQSEHMYINYIDPYWTPVRYRFYDTNTDFTGGASYDVSPTNMNAQLVNGYNFLHMATHGNQTIWSMETGGSYYSSNASAATNTGKYTNIVTIACITNAFESSFGTSDPCLSEAFIRNPNGGAVSYIGGSRYGWGWADFTSNGPSFQYDRMFYKFLFTGQPTTYPQNLGAVYSKMKEYFIGDASYQGAMRWCQFSINLAGDPEMPLYTANPGTISPVYENRIFVGTQNYVVETGVPNSKVCIMMLPDVYVYGNANSTGRFEAQISPSSTGTMSITITALNRYPYEGTVEILLASDGTVFIEENFVNDKSLITISLADADLAGQGIQNVTIETSIGNDFETVHLLETGPETGIFISTIATIPPYVEQNDGVLEVYDGDIITVRYIDLDDGKGGTNVEKTDTAFVDSAPPVFAGVSSATAGEGQVNLVWNPASDPRTPITYNIYRSQNSGRQDFSTPIAKTDATQFLDTSVINGISYFYVVRAEDSLGNEDNNFVEKSAMPQTPVAICEFNLDTNPGWSMQGDWAFGQPTGQGGEFGNPDPTSGYTGTNVYGYNLNGDYPNDIISTKYLTTTAINCNGYTSIKLRFWRWLGVERSKYDHAYIDVSNNGTSWFRIWENPDSEIADNSWSLKEYDISNVANNQPTVYIRWGLGPTDNAWRYCGWNIDDIVLTGISADTDEDGLPDSWEQQYFCNLNQSPYDDYDFDGLVEIDEFQYKTNPANPNTDNDALNDGSEAAIGANPAKFTRYVSDTDGNDSYDGLTPAFDGIHGPKKTIQSAVDDAFPGEEVAVLGGYYTGFGNRDIDLGGKSIAIRGLKGAVATVIDCQNAGRGFYCFGTTGEGAFIEGFTIKNGYTTDRGGGIHSAEGVVTIKDCIVANCYSSLNGAGIFNRLMSNVKIINCLVYGNYTPSQGAGIFGGNSTLYISNCTVIGNNAGYGGGLGCDTYANATVKDSIFRSNTAPFGSQISVRNSTYTSTVSISYCNIEGGQNGVTLMTGCTLNWGSGNINLDPYFTNGPLGIYYLSQIDAGDFIDSPCVNAGSDLSESVFMDKLTTMTTEGFDSGKVDMGYHYPLSAEVPITSLFVIGDSLTIQWLRQPGISYILEWSLDMNTWIQVPLGSVGLWTDTDTAGHSQKFYRVFAQ